MSKLIKDGDSLVSAKTSGGYEIHVYDDGFGPLWISRNSIGINGIVRARSWEDAYSICEDEFFPEADETIEQLVKEYGFKRENVKIIHPAHRKTSPVTYANGHVEEFDIETSVQRDATMADYQLTGGSLLPGQFVRWETRETPDADAWSENELFCEAYGFRPNGRNERDTIGHGIYSKDLNGDSLDRLTPELLADIGIELVIEAEESEESDPRDDPANNPDDGGRETLADA
jgi:hypothetical protein